MKENGLWTLGRQLLPLPQLVVSPQCNRLNRFFIYVGIVQVQQWKLKRWMRHGPCSWESFNLTVLLFMLVSDSHHFGHITSLYKILRQLLTACQIKSKFQAVCELAPDGLCRPSHTVPLGFVSLVSNLLAIFWKYLLRHVSAFAHAVLLG